MDATTHVSRATIARYAVGSLGTGGFATLPGLVLVYYLTDTLGIAALAAGLIVTLAKVWDVIIDPVIGATSDASLARTGSRRRFMMLGGLTLPVFFFLTFAVPTGLGPVASGIWVTLAFVLCATAFSLFQVPYIALPAELTSGYDDRTRLLTWRVVVLTLAILLFGAGGPILRGLADDARVGYLVMAAVAGLVIGAGMLISSRVAPQSHSFAFVAQRRSLGIAYRDGAATLARSAPFRALLATFMLQGLATGLMLAGAQYVATWVLRSEDAVTLLFVALIAPALLLAPVWGVVARRLGKYRTFVIASGVFALAAASMIALIWAPGGWVYLPVAVAGAAYAGMQSLPMAMLPDVISYDARTKGSGKAGTFSGVWTAGETTGMALGATTLTIVLALSGYLESVAGQAVSQPDSALVGIVVSFSAVPAVLMVLSLVTLRGYRLRRSDTDNEIEVVREVIA
ncbi:MFS transporter [Salinibacterium hongtaonis]|uniref:MFS transporter n=1 Tax=Homoserinimonas hongtaonis TaxID=2079791 RepID=UPI000D3A97AC|nr:MFS transporter [Salinibacterium hongtaonis]AWB89581.1 MFS transporter [Salinibacterium hongtaonis]